MQTRWMMLAILAACSSSPVTPQPDAGKPAPAGAPAEPPTKATTPSTSAASTPGAAVGSNPNAFLGSGTPTFVVGTAGDATSDRSTRGQARFIADLLFPGAAVVDDTTIDAGAWPERAVLYGGPQVHALLTSIAATLPFEMTADRLAIGGRTYTGEGIRLVTVIPARSETPAHPEFLLYAGTGPDGVAEINASLGKGSEGIVIADAFGPITHGRWTKAPDGTLTAGLEPDARRIEWRSVTRTVTGAKGSADVVFRFPAMLPAAADEDALIAAGLRGITRAITRLEIDSPAATVFHVYPDAGSKKSLTGNGGHGHAVPSSRSLHVLKGDTSEGGGIESLVAHEATHVLVRAPWGPPGSALLGEGIAVWASGRYAGKTLGEWKPAVVRRPIIDLLGKSFFQTPEPETYPIAGLFVEAAIAEVGLAKLRDHLFGATALTWPDACRAAGTTPEALEAALDRVIAAKE